MNIFYVFNYIFIVTGMYKINAANFKTSTDNSCVKTLLSENVGTKLDYLTEITYDDYRSNVLYVKHEFEILNEQLNSEYNYLAKEELNKKIVALYTNILTLFFKHLCTVNKINNNTWKKIFYNYHIKYAYSLYKESGMRVDKLFDQFTSEIFIYLISRLFCNYFVNVINDTDPEYYFKALGENSFIKEDFYFVYNEPRDLDKLGINYYKGFMYIRDKAISFLKNINSIARGNGGNELESEWIGEFKKIYYDVDSTDNSTDNIFQIVLKKIQLMNLEKIFFNNYGFDSPESICIIKLMLFCYVLKTRSDLTWSHELRISWEYVLCRLNYYILSFTREANYICNILLNKE